jgi:GNAT superfamily N-acetyltransferase
VTPAAMPALALVTAAERPELAEAMLSLGASPWPEFLNHDTVVEAHWRYLYELAPDYQFALLDENSGSLVAIGNCIPIRWDGDPHTLPDGGVDAVLEDGVACLREGATATAASALMIVVSPERLGQGISGEAIRAMAEVVGRHRLTELVAPVRPTHKHHYPLIPIERYIRWRRQDRLPFDPWVRVHERVGGEILRPAAAAMRVTGSVAEWERWTGIAMPESGSYVVPGALVPVEIDRERDLGEYQEPACWVRHHVQAT